MVISGKTLRTMGIITPSVERSVHEETGLSYGVSMCGYDVRLDNDVFVPQGFTVLASTLEKFSMPNDIVGIVHDKSTNARRGLFVQNTVIEPGWRGFLTLELTYFPVISPSEVKFMQENGSSRLEGNGIYLRQGTPIAQVLFHKTDVETEGYGDGKYQDQERGPQRAR